VWSPFAGEERGLEDAILLEGLKDIVYFEREGEITNPFILTINEVKASRAFLNDLSHFIAVDLNKIKILNDI